jgi:hypothetical protein
MNASIIFEHMYNISKNSTVYEEQLYNGHNLSIHDNPVFNDISTYNVTPANVSNLGFEDSTEADWSISQVFLLMIITFLTIIAAVGNGLVITAWFAESSIRTPSNVLLVALAIPDLLIWVFCVPITVKVLNSISVKKFLAICPIKS